MPFKAGDLLLSVDVRAWVSDRVNTRNHVMLVIGETDGYPIICHLTFASGIKIETLTRIRNKVLLHYPKFDKAFRKKLVQLAEEISKTKISITRDHLELQLQMVSQHELNFPVGYQRAQAHFSKLYLKNFKSYSSDMPMVQSCHEFVLRLMCQAAVDTDQTLPYSLQLPPTMAWSNIINRFAKDDSQCIYKYLDHYSSTVNTYHAFFPEAQKKPSKKTAKPKSNQCIIA